MQKRMFFGVLILALLINAVLIAIGVKSNPDFFELSLSGLLSLNLTALISVFFVQELASKRRRYDFLVKTLNDICKDIQEDYLFDHSNNLKAAMLQKSISNRVYFVSLACQGGASKEIDYIKEKFEELQTYYGDHSDVGPDDPHYEREKTNIKDKILKLQLRLYGFEMK